MACSTGAGAEAPRSTTGQRVVAVGDLHGDLDNALAVLRLAGLVDDAGSWAGGATVLVQTGDLVDRGDEGREVLALLRRLQEEAAAAGGRVVQLLGNHELMNLTGDWRYVSTGDLAGYGGRAGREAAFGPLGEDGAWLRTLPVVAVVEGTVFVHGGVTPARAALGVEALNREVPRVLAGTLVADPESPTWYRGYLQEPEPLACANLERALVALGARRMVVGHTTQRSGDVAVRCGGRLLGIDTGISDAYGGHLNALELRGGDARALTPAGPVDLPDP